MQNNGRLQCTMGQGLSRGREPSLEGCGGPLWLRPPGGQPLCPALPRPPEGSAPVPGPLPEPSRCISAAAATGLRLLHDQAEDLAAKGLSSPARTLSLPWGSLSLTELFHSMLLLSFTVGRVTFFFRGETIFTGSRVPSS